jgi:branched chain amino acid efflux pump
VTVSPEVLLAIAGMAAVTYVTRVAGLVLMPRLPASPWLDRWIAAVPGSVLAAIVAPAVFTQGVPALVAAGVTVVVASRGSGLLLPVAAGVLAVLLLRSFL